MWNFISHKCPFYVVYFLGLKYPLTSDLLCYPTNSRIHSPYKSWKTDYNRSLKVMENYLGCSVLTLLVVCSCSGRTKKEDTSPVRHLAYYTVHLLLGQFDFWISRSLCTYTELRNHCRYGSRMNSRISILVVTICEVCTI